MDTTITTDPDGEEENTTQDSPLMAEGGAIAKQAIQPIQTIGPIEEGDEQQQAQQPNKHITPRSTRTTTSHSVGYQEI